MAERLATWVSSTVLAVGDQRQGLRQRLLGPGQQQVAVVDQPAQVVAGALEGLAELVDDRAQVLLVEGADQLVHVEQQLLDRDRDRGPVHAG